MLQKFFTRTKRLFALCLALLFCLTGCKSSPEKTSVTKKTTPSTTVTTAGTKESHATSETTGATTGKPDVTPTPKKKVALTFDDGPHIKYTVAIADELEKYGFHATFFVVGNRVDGTEYGGGNTLKYIIEGGHEVAVHGYTHTVHYDTCSEEIYNEEISKTIAAIKLYDADYEPRLVRPIGGRISQARVDASPYSIILWSVDSEDWKQKYYPEDNEQKKAAKLEKIVNDVMAEVEEGSIILMHDIYESTYDAVKIILKKLNEEGYEVVTVSELIGEPKPGTKYREKAE